MASTVHQTLPGTGTDAAALSKRGLAASTSRRNTRRNLAASSADACGGLIFVLADSGTDPGARGDLAACTASACSGLIPLAGIGTDAGAGARRNLAASTASACAGLGVSPRFNLAASLAAACGGLMPLADFGAGAGAGARGDLVPPTAAACMAANLHRPTVDVAGGAAGAVVNIACRSCLIIFSASSEFAARALTASRSSAVEMYRRKLNWKATFESGSAYPNLESVDYVQAVPTGGFISSPPYRERVPCLRRRRRCYRCRAVGVSRCRRRRHRCLGDSRCRGGSRCR